jgi:hypothetical protein
MASQFKKNVFAFSSEAPACFLNLFEAKAVVINGKDSGTPKFSANFLLDPESANAQTLRNVAIATAKEQWPGRALSGLKFPWENGDASADRAEARGKDRSFYRGKVVLISRSQIAPTLGVLNGKTIQQFEGNDDRRVSLKPKFYNGVLVLATFTLQAYQGVGANPDGVTAYLDSVVSLNRGERIGGGSRDLAQTFSGYIGLQSGVDPTAGSDMDDEIPF